MRELRSTREISDEIDRLAHEHPETIGLWDGRVHFMAGPRFRAGRGECNWHLMVIPPVAEPVRQAIEGAGQAVQNRWNLRFNSAGGRLLIV